MDAIDGLQLHGLLRNVRKGLDRARAGQAAATAAPPERHPARARRTFHHGSQITTRLSCQLSLDGAEESSRAQLRPQSLQGQGPTHDARTRLRPTPLGCVSDSLACVDAPDFGRADHDQRALGLVEVPEDVLALLLRERAVEPAVLEALAGEHALDEVEEAGEAAPVSSATVRIRTC